MSRATNRHASAVRFYLGSGCPARELEQMAKCGDAAAAEALTVLRRRPAATVCPLPARPPRAADECRGCGEKQPEPLDRRWPWCMTCTLRWRVELGDQRTGRVPPPARVRR